MESRGKAQCVWCRCTNPCSNWIFLHRRRNSNSQSDYSMLFCQWKIHDFISLYEQSATRFNGVERGKVRIERRGPFTQALDGSRITNHGDIVSIQKRAFYACRRRLGDSNQRRAWWWMDGDFICLWISDIDEVFRVDEECREIRSDADQRSNISFPLATTRDLEWIHCDH